MEVTEIARLDVDGLLELLKKKNLVDGTIENEMKKQRVDGETFLELSESEFKEVGFQTFAQREAILRIQRDWLSNKRTGQNNVLLNDSETPTTSINMFDDLKALLLVNSQGAEIMQQLETDGHFTTQNLELFVKICTNILIQNALECGDKKQYPSTMLKVEFAKAIIQHFPALKSKVEKCEGYEHFFDPATQSGYIESRLKKMRRKQEEKAYKKRGLKRKQSSDSSADSDITVDLRDSPEMDPINEKVTWLQQTKPTPEIMPQIHSAMEATFEFRRLDVQHSQSITQILQKYPRFIDVDCGQLVLKEYFQLKQTAQNMIDFFPSFAVKINTFARKIPSKYGKITDENLKAVLALQTLLPPLNMKGDMGNRQHPVIIFQGEGLNVEEYASSKPKDFTQPFLLAVGQMSNPDHFFLILDNVALDVGSDFLSAFQKLFASFWAFDVKYYSKLIPFYNFFEVVCLEMKAVCSVYALLSAVL